MDLLKRPSTDFAAVRDGRQSMPLYIDIDLTTARSISGANPLILNIAGNSFYTDADTTNGGNAIVHFQDTNLGNASAPFFVSPGFIANVGFTQLLIENTAQAGKRMRIFYGVDIDFQAGVNASNITGSVSINNTIGSPAYVFESGEDMSYQNFKANSILTPGTAEQIVAPGTNTAGLLIYSADYSGLAASAGEAALIAKATAPTSVVDGSVIKVTKCFYNGTNDSHAFEVNKPVRVPAGLGLYFITNVTDSRNIRRVTYRVL